MDHVNWLITINGATLGAIVLFGARLLRFINRMEFKVDLLWQDYETRTVQPPHAHARREDYR